MFKDKAYEELDDISKLIEPFQGSINDELAKFPDEIEIDQKTIFKTINSGWGWGTIRLVNIISDKAEELNLKDILKNCDQIARQFFKIKVEEEEITVNFETNTVSHKIFVVKTKIGFDDAELEKQAEKNIINPILARLSSNRSVNKSRMNEVADLYGALDVRKDRTYRGKVRKFCKHLEKLIQDKELDIKDLNLCKKFSKWVILYVKDGNLAALSNITKIKIMMHEDRPIYSIEERSVE